MVDNPGFMTPPADEETEARSLPLLTYSVLGKKIVSLRDENNFAVSSALSGAVPTLCAPYYSSALSPVGSTGRLPQAVEEVGAIP
jgi:hypothetical protein